MNAKLHYMLLYLIVLRIVSSFFIESKMLYCLEEIW